MVQSRQTLTPERLAGLDETIEMAQSYLLGFQYPDGYWWGELESNPTMEAEFLLLTHFLGVADREQWRKLANHIKGCQRSDGTWGQYYGAPGDLSTSTECYFALKMAGVSPDEPYMRKARDFILSKGGVPKTRVFTKIWLALFGQWDWKGVPILPPEMMLLPNWFPINIYDFASWARATIVSLLVLMDKKPVREIPEFARVDELYPLPRSETDYSIPRPRNLRGWDRFFCHVDDALRQLEKLPWNPLRPYAMKRAERWILEHQEASGSWAGIQPPWVYSLMALHELGYSTDHPVMAKGLAGFELFSIEERNTLRIQACLSPVWDTCLAMIALVDSGVPSDHPALVRSAEWLLDEQILTGGDWQGKANGVPPGGWAFEFHNDLYPDVDDTAEIVMALDKVEIPDEARKREAMDRAVQWLLGMQSSNGGWAAFDKDNTKKFIAKIPFADFGEALDPPTVDVTAHVLEMAGQLGYPTSHPAVAEALRYVLDEQEDDGPWFGRWGVNYLYGSAAVLPALEALGISPRSERVERALDWVIAHQNDDGGWGESCASYVDPAFRGRGPSTPSQTAWGIMCLMSGGQASHPSTERGVEYLIRTQLEEGSWDEPYFTGAGFPGYGVGDRLDRYLTPGDPGYQGSELPAGFMINYHMYRNYWPLTALGRYKKLRLGQTNNGVALKDAERTENIRG